MYLLDKFRAWRFKSWVIRNNTYSYDKFSIFLDDMRVGDGRAYRYNGRFHPSMDSYDTTKLECSRFGKVVLAHMRTNELLVLRIAYRNFYGDGHVFSAMNEEQRKKTRSIVQKLVYDVMQRSFTDSEIKINSLLEEAMKEIDGFIDGDKEAVNKAVASKFNNTRANALMARANAIVEKNPTYKARWRKIAMILKDTDELSGQMLTKLLDNVETKLHDHEAFYRDSVNVSQDINKKIVYEVAMDALKSL